MSDRVFLQHLVWLVTNDLDYVERFGPDLVRVDLGTTEELQWLISAAVRFYRKTGGVYTHQALELELERKIEHRNFDKDVVLQLYEEALPSDGKGFRDWVIEYTLQWMQGRTAGIKAQEAIERLEMGEVTEALEILASVKDDTASLVQERLGLGWDPSSIETFLAMNAEKYSKDPAVSGVIPCYLPLVDERMGGGVRPGELAIMLAPSGTGKTHWLVWTGRRNSTKGKFVMFYTLEMNEQDIQQRIFSGVIDRAYADFSDTKSLGRDLDEKLKKLPESGETIVRFYPSGTISTDDLHRHLKFVNREIGKLPDLVCIDYGDLLRAPRKYERRVDELAQVYGGLQRLAQEFHVPLWTASQTNRTAHHKDTFTLKDVADSWDKVKVADWVLGFAQSQKMQMDQRGNICFLKTRHMKPSDPVEIETAFERSVWTDVGVAGVRND